MEPSSKRKPALLTAEASLIPGVTWDREAFCWLSADRLLSIVTEQEADSGEEKYKRTVRRNRRGYPPVAQGRPIAGSAETVCHNWKGHADLIDPNTGARTLLPGLTDLLNRTMVLPITWLTEFKAAPGGDWIFWESWEMGDEKCGRHSFHSASYDGSSYREWSEIHHDTHFFLDARHLVQLTCREPQVIIRDLQDPDKDLRYADTDMMQEVFERCAPRQPVYLNVHPCYRGGEERIAVIDIYRPEDRLPFLLHEMYRPDSVSPPLETYEFELPEGTLYTPSMAIISPDQSWICYSLYIRRHRPRGARLQGKMDRKYRAFDALWVSRADGSGMREIGEVPREPSSKNRLSFPLSDVQWMPDGKSLSFIHSKRLYVVQVEEEEQK